MWSAVVLMLFVSFLACLFQMPAVADGRDQKLRAKPRVDRILEKGLHVSDGSGWLCCHGLVMLYLLKRITLDVLLFSFARFRVSDDGIYTCPHE